MWLLIAIALAVAGGPDRPTLRGVVQAAGGAPLANAKVLIYTAQPRVGTSSFCPSCYIDCGRSATTGPDGRFEIPGLDPSLLFRVVAVAPKHQALFQEGVDPTGAALSLTLPLSPSLPTNPKQVLRGQVVGPTGPVAVAIIEPQGYTRAQGNNERSFFGSTDKIMPPTITDSAGGFEIFLGVEADSVVLLVSPRGLTRRTYARVPTGFAPTKLSVSYGAGVRGRVVKVGQSLPGVAVNVEQKDKNAERWVGTYSARTDASGAFLISNALPDEEMIAVAEVAFGYTPARPFKTGADGAIVDLGDVEVREGHRLTGRVVLSDGKEVPPQTRLLLIRDSMASDTREVVLSREGAFEIASVPDEAVSLSIRVPGYGLSKQNGSLVPRGDSLLGAVPRDLTIRVLLEPSSQPVSQAIDQATAKARSEALAALREKPLAGVSGEPPQ